MSSLLDEIVNYKKSFVAQRKKTVSAATLAAQLTQCDAPRGFIEALAQRVRQQAHAVIAEVKRASPSKGVIAPHFDAVFAAQQYALHGAACLSVLTDERYFQGCDAYFTQVRNAVALPMLRKDFMVDEYQVMESRCLGADAVLLIAAVLDDAQLKDYHDLAVDLAMDVLVEVHNHEELARALRLPIRVVGVNNRNLHDFSVDVQTTIDLLQQVPHDGFVISESGITRPEDIRRLRQSGVYAYLIGGHLMAQDNPGLALQQLLMSV